MSESGIYIVRLTTDELMPVTRDPRYTDICACVNRENIKFGKTEDFEVRRKKCIANFDEENIIFEILYKIKDTTTADHLITKELKPFQKLSPKNRRLEWLEGISYEEVKSRIAKVIEKSGLEYET